MKDIISKDASVGKNVIIKEGVIIGKNVIIEDDVYIDYGCIIRDNVQIKKGSFVGCRSILGEYIMDFYKDRKNKEHKLVIGENSIIRTENVIYGDTIIGDNFNTGHKVTIREQTVIGNNCSVGTLGDIQGYAKIGNNCRFHSNVHICQKSKIADNVWIFPYTVLTNDPHPPCAMCLEGPQVDEYAVIATHSMILPGVHIGRSALIGGMSFVTRDVEEEAVVVGNPAKKICTIHDIKCHKGIIDKPYPWQDRLKK